jgi:hypothetical protein
MGLYSIEFGFVIRFFKQEKKNQNRIKRYMEKNK